MLNQNLPLLSIILPSGGSFVDELRGLDSIEESYIPFDLEIIIVNDHSSQEVTKKLLSFKEQSRFSVKYIEVDNHAPGRSRNDGLKIATGKYVSFIDIDDQVTKNYLHYIMLFAFDSGYPEIMFSCYKKTKSNISAMIKKQKMGASPNGWFYLRSFLNKYDLQFSNLKNNSGDDPLFTNLAQQYCKRYKHRMAIYNNPFEYYIYYITSNGITNNRKSIEDSQMERFLTQKEFRLSYFKFDEKQEIALGFYSLAYHHAIILSRRLMNNKLKYFEIINIIKKDIQILNFSQIYISNNLYEKYKLHYGYRFYLWSRCSARLNSLRSQKIFVHKLVFAYLYLQTPLLFLVRKNWKMLNILVYPLILYKVLLKEIYIDKQN